MNRILWETVGGRQKPSWYLDPITALQKRETHLRLIRKWSKEVRTDRILKTDLFEEAFGQDSLLDSLFPRAAPGYGLDAAFSAAISAAKRHPDRIRPFTCDVKHLSVLDASVDLVISTSTLDHFGKRDEFLQALGEVVRVIRPGGLLIITLDNPWNLLYHALRWFSRGRKSPFPLGYTESVPQLERDLVRMGLQPENRDWLLHNPRGVSTLLFLAIRKLLSGSMADRCIGALLSGFELLDKLPTRKVTSCFVAVAARKPLETTTLPGHSCQ